MILPEYPRPQLVREDWLNLNGRWEYAIALRGDAQPAAYDGEILVPFPIESTLSGVGKSVHWSRRLWYHRTFEIPQGWRQGRVLLHFGAVDWEATVWVNGVEVGAHQGGYDPFSFDVTDALGAENPQEIVVAVWDPSDAGTQPRGKQVNSPHSIWYTPTTGIWQTVWLEPVPEAYVAGLKMTPDVDGGLLHVEAQVHAGAGAELRAVVLDGERVVSEVRQPADQALALPVPDAKLWSPESPFLYDLQVFLLVDGEAVDRVISYFGMRKIALEVGSDGAARFYLNNEPVFHYGLLDQGFWPDGLYTAPTDEALRSDIEITKALGFNMIRKHVKVEPARWYYWADKLGVLVWQDMPSGDAMVGPGEGQIQRTPESAAVFEHELKQMIDALYNSPSIVIWVVFNEGWGQYDTIRVSNWTQAYDPSRLINSVSGWNDMGVGHMLDIHAYPGPQVPPTSESRAAVLGEFGGLGLPMEGHLWQEDMNWGYRAFDDQTALVDAYVALLEQLGGMIREQGLAAAVYTQTTDVEIEVNGMLTYDREVVKMDLARVQAANLALYDLMPRE